MKNKKLFLKIYIPFVIVITVALIVLQILGSKTRIGYLTDFELNNFYEITNSDNTISTNYVYRFKIRYYDKVFRNSDIYGVYPDLSSLPDYIKETGMDMGGSPFGNFVSSKIIEEDKIDNVNYILRIKHLIVFLLIIILLIYFCIRKFKNIFNYSSLTPIRLDYILLGVIIGLCFFSYIYSDVLVVFPFSVNFWNVNPTYFFYEVYNKVGSYHKPDDLPYLAYVIYAILFLPLWIYSKIRGITYYTWHHQNFEIGFLEVMYIKFILLFFVLASSYLLYKISKKTGISENSSKWVSFIFMSSPLTILPVFVISQVEIIMTFFTLLAISDYLDNNKRYIFWFSIAIPLKLFPFFIFIPLTLLREKDFKKIIINIIVVILPYIITQIIFKSPDPSNRNSVAFSTIMNYKTIGSSTFIIIYGIICLYSFWQNKYNYDKYKFNRLSIYIVLITFALVLLVNSSMHLYWIVIISPIISLVMFFNNKYFKINMLLEFIVISCYALILSYSGTLITMGEATRTKSIPFIKLFVKEYKFNNIRDIFPNIFQNADITNAVYSLFVTAIICILIVNFPKKDNIFLIDNEENNNIDRKLIFFRFIPSLFIICLIWYLGLAK